MSAPVKYPHIKVKLIGGDGNALAIIGAVSRALKEHGVPLEEREKFSKEAISGDYNDLLNTCMNWVVVK